MSILNKKTVQVSDVMMNINRFPVVRENIILKEALEQMVKTRIGITCVVNHDQKLIGIFTDGDLRRMLLKVQKPLSAILIDDVIKHAIHLPKTVFPSSTLDNAVKTMRYNQIWDLPVVNKEGVLVGLLHLHPAVETLLNLQD